MDRRIILRAPVTTTNTRNEPVISYPTDTATVWGRVIYERGVEAYASNQVDAQRFATFRIRYRADLALNETWQAEHDGQTYNILGVLELGRREGWDLKCAAQVP